jgi:hypothetical protein
MLRSFVQTTEYLCWSYFQRLISKYSAATTYVVHEPTKNQLLVWLRTASMETMQWSAVTLQYEGTE